MLHEFINIATLKIYNLLIKKSVQLNPSFFQQLLIIFRGNSV
jgi:hypothetical protein